MLIQKDCEPFPMGHLGQMQPSPSLCGGVIYLLIDSELLNFLRATSSDHLRSTLYPYYDHLLQTHPSQMSCYTGFQ